MIANNPEITVAPMVGASNTDGPLTVTVTDTTTVHD